MCWSSSSECPFPRVILAHGCQLSCFVLQNNQDWTIERLIELDEICAHVTPFPNTSLVLVALSPDCTAPFNVATVDTQLMGLMNNFMIAMSLLSLFYSLVRLLNQYCFFENQMGVFILCHSSVVQISIPWKVRQKWNSGARRWKRIRHCYSCNEHRVHLVPGFRPTDRQVQAHSDVERATLSTSWCRSPQRCNPFSASVLSWRGLNFMSFFNDFFCVFYFWAYCTLWLSTQNAKQRTITF